ncbi:MAG: type I methionyl aminopeptidase [Planctomycetales bacterium]|nr:type I methionyl aminopeptidase [Planctomycetales bacterium]
MLNLRSRREISKMRRAGLLVWEAHQIVKRLIEPGIATRQIDKDVESFFELHGAEPLFKGYPGKKNPFPAVTCISLNDEVVHGIPSNRQLAEGDIVSVDTGCRIDGWCGDSAWTYAVGEVAKPAREMLEVGEGALDTAISCFGNSEMWSQVAAAISEYANSRGCSVVESLVGHGVGREMHEPPQVPNFVSEKTLIEDFPLRPGLVLAIEPMINAGASTVKDGGDGWTVVTADSSLSVHFEHTVALTADGPMRLTAAPGTEIDTWLGS